VPAEDGLRLDQDESLAPSGPELGEPDPHQSIGRPKLCSPLSANVSETLTPSAITVGRWKVTIDGRREGSHDIERTFSPRRGG
jgi:hypothetical protein